MAHEVNLDVTHSELLSLSPELDDDDEHEEREYPLDGGADPSMACCAPDVFIIPSRLKQFSKVCPGHCMEGEHYIADHALFI